jgi:hypothetical protein
VKRLRRKILLKYFLTRREKDHLYYRSGLRHNSSGRDALASSHLVHELLSKLERGQRRAQTVARTAHEPVPTSLIVGDYGKDRRAEGAAVHRIPRREEAAPASAGAA